MKHKTNSRRPKSLEANSFFLVNLVLSVCSLCSTLNLIQVKHMFVYTYFSPEVRTFLNLENPRQAPPDEDIDTLDMSDQVNIAGTLKRYH